MSTRALCRTEKNFPQLQGRTAASPQTISPKVPPLPHGDLQPAASPGITAHLLALTLKGLPPDILRADPPKTSSTQIYLGGCSPGSLICNQVFPHVTGTQLEVQSPKVSQPITELSKNPGLIKALEQHCPGEAQPCHSLARLLSLFSHLRDFSFKFPPRSLSSASAVPHWLHEICT